MSFCANPGLKTRALIHMHWEKSGSKTYLFLFDMEKPVAIIRPSKGKFSSHITPEGLPLVDKKYRSLIKAGTSILNVSTNQPKNYNMDCVHDVLNLG